jgi:ubiquinone/menaquinone biosynthesis C-methylase UbiE
VSADEIAELKSRVRDGWTASEYTGLGRLLRPAAQELLDACAISAGQEVLDVACGDGNLAILSALEGAAVTGTDLSPGQLERARARAEAEGVDIDWVEGDAEALPFDDESFDCAASVFGAFIAPRPDVVSGELFRVVRPGGTVGMANWAPVGFQRGFFEILRKYGPPRPASVPDQSLWGEEETIRERFGPYASSIAIELRTLPWRFESFPAMGEFFLRTSPGGRAAAESQDPDMREQMVAELSELVREHNDADDGSIHFDVAYVVVVARKRG